jgi:hypothetical protein
MDQFIVYNTALVFHIVGITIMAGATFIDYITFTQFWKTYFNDKAQGIVIENFAFRLQRFMGIGMLLILLSGVGMMIYLHEVWGQQMWFRIKMGILLLIIINGLALRRTLGKRLKTFLANDLALEDTRFSKLKMNMTIIQIVQILLFIIIFTLSVFKFN